MVIVERMVSLILRMPTVIQIVENLNLKPGDYRWNYEELTDQIYNDHLNGTKSIGIQPVMKKGKLNLDLLI